MAVPPTARWEYSAKWPSMATKWLLNGCCQPSCRLRPSTCSRCTNRDGKGICSRMAVPQAAAGHTLVLVAVCVPADGRLDLDRRLQLELLVGPGLPADEHVSAYSCGTGPPGVAAVLQAGVHQLTAATATAGVLHRGRSCKASPARARRSRPCASPPSAAGREFCHVAGIPSTCTRCFIQQGWRESTTTAPLAVDETVMFAGTPSQSLLKTPTKGRGWCSRNGRTLAAGCLRLDRSPAGQQDHLHPQHREHVLAYSRGRDYPSELQLYAVT